MFPSMHLSLRFSARYLYPRKYSRNWTLNPLQSPAYGTVCFFSPKFLVEITKIILFYIRIVLINILPAFVRQCCRPLLSFYWYFTKYPLSLLTTQNSVEVTQKTLFCTRVLYSSFVMFWSAITAYRNSFRFVFHWYYRSVAVYSEVGECCTRRVVWMRGTAGGKQHDSTVIRMQQRLFLCSQFCLHIPRGEGRLLKQLLPTEQGGREKAA